MKKISLSFYLSAILFAKISLASSPPVKYTGEPKKVDAAGEEVLVYPTASLTLDKENIEMKLTGHGVGIVNMGIDVPVFYAESYIDSKTTLSTTDPLSSLRKAKAKLLKLTILMQELPAELVAGRFKSILKYNDVDVDKDPIKTLFDQFKGDLKLHDIAKFTGYPGGAESVEKLNLDTPAIALEGEGNGLATDAWRVFFGKQLPGDDNMAQLKKQLLGGNL